MWAMHSSNSLFFQELSLTEKGGKNSSVSSFESIPIYSINVYWRYLTVAELLHLML